MTIPKHIENYWTTFLNSDSSPANANDLFLESFQVGATPEQADAGAKLILCGGKTVTSSLLWEYEESGNPLPSVGALSAVEDGSYNPVCVVRTTWVEIMPVGEIDAEFVRDYGETDGSLASWHRVFGTYYDQQCRSMGREYTDNTPLVCERFEVVFIDS